MNLSTNNRPSRNTIGTCGPALVVLLAASALQADEGKWISLFDGKTLTGWKASEQAGNWKVEDGAIVASGPRSHLFYFGSDEAHPADFVNFHFKAEVMTKPRSNSGIYFHSQFLPDDWPHLGHECQINNTYVADPQKTAGIYNIVKVLKSPAEDNRWFTVEVIVNVPRIITKIDGKTIVDYVEPADAKGDRRLSHGTFALQAHNEGSVTRYRNIQVQRLPSPAK